MHRISSVGGVNAYTTGIAETNRGGAGEIPRASEAVSGRFQSLGAGADAEGAAAGGKNAWTADRGRAGYDCTAAGAAADVAGQRRAARGVAAGAVAAVLTRRAADPAAQCCRRGTRPIATHLPECATRPATTDLSVRATGGSATGTAG